METWITLPSRENGRMMDAQLETLTLRVEGMDCADEVALIGRIGLVPGLLLNEVSALIVILNALRLLSIKVSERHLP